MFLLAGACARHAHSNSIRRLALLPANVLIADPSSDWMRVAVPLVVTQDLSPAHDLVTSLAQDESGVYAARAAIALRITIEEREGGLELEATFTNLQTQRTERVETLRTSAANLIASLDKLSREIDSAAVSFGTHNSRALQSLAAGAFASDLQSKVDHLKDAISADPTFGLPYTLLLETLASAKSPGIASISAKADVERSFFTPVDRARYEFVRARALNEPLEKQAAAGLALVHVSTNDAETLATVASVLFVSDHASDASQLLRHALELNPANATLKQQLALGLLENRQFAEAERILNTMSGDPAAQPLLAFCILFEGARARAGGIYQHYLDTVPSPDAKTLLHAAWLAHSGDRNAAVQALEHAQFQDPRLAAYAKTQLVVLYLLNNDKTNARKWTENAGAIASLLAAGASSPAEWRARVDALPDSAVNATVKRALLANGYFLFGFYPAAADAWKQIYEETGETDLRARVMLAASLERAGRADEAKRLKVQPFVPDLNELFSAVSFSELRRLLG